MKFCFCREIIKIRLTELRFENCQIKMRKKRSVSTFQVFHIFGQRLYYTKIDIYTPVTTQNESIISYFKMLISSHFVALPHILILAYLTTLAHYRILSRCRCHETDHMAVCFYRFSIIFISFQPDTRSRQRRTIFYVKSNLSKQPPPNNDHLTTTTTIWGSIFTFYNIKLPLNNDHLSITTTNLGSRGWSLYTGLTVCSKNVFNFASISDDFFQSFYF